MVTTTRSFTATQTGEFFQAAHRGELCAVDEGLFDHFLNVLPPYFMGQLVTLWPSNRKVYALFGFVEGSDWVIAFWREGGKHYAQRTTIMARG